MKLNPRQLPAASNHRHPSIDDVSKTVTWQGWREASDLEARAAAVTVADCVPDEVLTMLEALGINPEEIRHAMPDWGDA